jgi:hypothetical protein
MKKNLLLFGLLAAACCGSVSAQSKINGAGRIMLDSYQVNSKLKGVEADKTVLALVTLNEGYDTAALTEAGFTVSNTIGSEIATVRVALSQVEALAALDAVKAVDFGTQSRPYLDVAREMTNVDGINDGTADGLSGHAYTGKGVTVGLYDTGLDPNHSAFRNADGSSRVKGIYVRRDDSKSNQDITDPSSILEFSTEDNSETHGTHVLGIMAGARGLNGKIASNKTGEIPYYGPAYNSDIVIGCGDFYDAQIIDGIAAVVNRAKELGQPAVVNLSLGGNTGAHDPNSSTSKSLDELGKSAIICISAGNEGDLPMSITKRFTANSTNLNTFIVPQNSTTSSLTYSAEFWHDNSDTFTCALVLYDKSTGKVVESVNIPANGRGSLSSSNSSYMAEQYSSSSTVNASASVDANTQRYNVYIYGSVTPTRTPTYLIGVNITSSTGHTVRAYVNTYTSSNDDEAIFSKEDVSGYTSGTANGTINGFSCGHNMISVGAYVSRTSCPYVGTGSYVGSGSVGSIASFSSYGETSDGRKLPNVCGPGAQVVSTVSLYWMKNVMSDAMNNNRFCALNSDNGRDNYWYPMQGTSMSSPFVAGCIALWLEAWPDMTAAQCLEIINATSVAQTPSNRWGAGKLDALAGLKMAIDRNASLGNVLADKNEKNLVIENLGGQNYSVCYVGAENVNVNVYNLQGANVLATSANGDTATLDASGLNSGIYVVNVTTPAGSFARKLAIK